jgi:N-acetylgalactosamine-N,N'-diacetylbacillosaminyl-diphospho-undecaprenol 4-alpha-N-acetylgalactosaminyltransferase
MGGPAMNATLPVGAKITFLINSMEGGGAERAMANLLGYLLPQLAEYRVELVLLDDRPRAQVLPEGIDVITLDGRGRTLRSLFQLWAHWRKPEHRPSVCVSFLARANVLNVWLAPFARHRAIISERVNTSGHIAGSRLAPVLRAVTRWTYPKASHVVAVSRGVAEDLEENFGVSTRQMSVIGNAIDRQRLVSLASADPAVELPADFLLGLGRLVANKNFALTLDAYARVVRAPPLVIMGQGPEEKALREQAARLGLGNRVHFTGFLDNPYPVIARARALISASRAEGFPNTLVEALALGCPVIATNCPSGPAEVLEATAAKGPPWPRKGHGILVPMDDPDAMAAAIETLCEDVTRADFAARARRRGEAFAHKRVIDAYLNLILAGETNCSQPDMVDL